MTKMTSASHNLRKKIQELSQIVYKAATVGDCIGCGTCVRYCPLNIREFNAAGKAITIKSARTCGGCSVCKQRCPQDAIQLIQLKRK